MAQREKDEKGWLTSLGHGTELEKAHLQEDRVPELLFLTQPAAAEFKLY